MRPRHFQRIALLLLIAALCVVAACRPAKPRALNYRVATSPKTFNYLIVENDEPTLIVAFYLMGGRLVEFDHAKRQYVPGVAETWKPGDGGRGMELTLRDGVKFSDGHPLTAEDVVFTLRALYDERTAAPLFRDAMLINGRQIEAVAIDARRLRLTFPEPVALPEGYLSNLVVMPRHALEADFNQGTLRNAYSLTSDPRRIVTAGAFAAYSAVPGERVTLKRNPHYWKKDSGGKPLPYLDELVIEVVGDPNNALARLKQGGLDIFDRIRPNDYAALRSEAGAASAVDLGPGLNTDHLWFNLNTGQINGKPAVNPVKAAWFADVRFRRAVSHAIDRETMATVTLQGLATPLYGFVSPGNREWAAEGLPRTNYDLEKSRALLNEAGFVLRGSQSKAELYDAKGNRVELTLIVPVESQPRVQMATVAQADLAKLGIKLQVAPIGFNELQNRISQSYDYDAALLGVAPMEPDPSSYANVLLSSSLSNQWHPKQKQPATEWEARIDQLLAALAREVVVEKRRAIFREIQSILAEQLPVIPLVARHTASAANRRVANHRQSTLIPYSLWNAEELVVR